MVKIYTRRGDRGTTSLLGGARIGKDAPTIELLGALDEAQAALGVARLCRDAHRARSGRRPRPRCATARSDNVAHRGDRA